MGGKTAGQRLYFASDAPSAKRACNALATHFCNAEREQNGQNNQPGRRRTLWITLWTPHPNHQTDRSVRNVLPFHHPTKEPRLKHINGLTYPTYGIEILHTDTNRWAPQHAAAAAAMRASELDPTAPSFLDAVHAAKLIPFKTDEQIRTESMAAAEASEARVLAAALRSLGYINA